MQLMLRQAHTSCNMKHDGCGSSRQKLHMSAKGCRLETKRAERRGALCYFCTDAKVRTTAHSTSSCRVCRRRCRGRASKQLCRVLPFTARPNVQQAWCRAENLVCGSLHDCSCIPTRKVALAGMWMPQHSAVSHPTVGTASWHELRPLQSPRHVGQGPSLPTHMEEAHWPCPD